jgi:hypothetical protein
MSKTSAEQSAIEPRAIHALVSGLVDYAGLFPPAKLDMQSAVDAYASYLDSDDVWVLGRFIVPASRLGEFEQAAKKHLSKDDDGEPWPMSVLLEDDLDKELDAIYAFNDRHTQEKNGLALIDAVEIKVPFDSAKGLTSPDANFIDDIVERVPQELFPFFELPTLALSDGSMPDLRGCIAALAGAEAGAKIRTGGLTANAFPTARAIARFIADCRVADVPFKATAGLHHPVRGEQNLTYEPGCARAVMHGFLNVFLAAVFHDAHDIPEGKMVQILEQTSLDEFTFTAREIRYRDLSVSMDDIDATRDMFAMSFGSCSFREPVDELRALKLI